MKLVRILALSALASLAACNKADTGATSDAAKADNTPVATVNGKAITRSFFDGYIKAISGKTSADLTPEQKEQALDNLVRAQLVAEQAAKDGTDKAPDTAVMLELSRLNILQQAESQKFLEGKVPTDQELRAEYETQVGAMPRLEYHARHILVASEDAAKKVIDQLKSGSKFEDLAKRESSDSSKTNGGDLGWFTPDRMVPPFSAAVVALKKGEVTQTPVQTQYGWHVIKLEDTRDVTPPPFDSVKDRLVQVVQAKKFKAHTDALLAAAKVEKKL